MSLCVIHLVFCLKFKSQHSMLGKNFWGFRFDHEIITRKYSFLLYLVKKKERFYKSINHDQLKRYNTYQNIRIRE